MIDWWNLFSEGQVKQHDVNCDENWLCWWKFIYVMIDFQFNWKIITKINKRYENSFRWWKSWLWWCQHFQNYHYFRVIIPIFSLKWKYWCQIGDNFGNVDTISVAEFGNTDTKKFKNSSSILIFTCKTYKLRGGASMSTFRVGLLVNFCYFIIENPFI